MSSSLYNPLSKGGRPRYPSSAFVGASKSSPMHVGAFLDQAQHAVGVPGLDEDARSALELGAFAPDVQPAALSVARGRRRRSRRFRKPDMEEGEPISCAYAGPTGGYRERVPPGAPKPAAVGWTTGSAAMAACCGSIEGGLASLGDSDRSVTRRRWPRQA